MTVVELVLSLAAILAATALFAKAVEIMGERLNLGQGTAGSVPTAVGPALPETVTPIVAVLGAAEIVQEAQERERAAGRPADPDMTLGDALEILGR